MNIKRPIIFLLVIFLSIPTLTSFGGMALHKKIRDIQIDVLNKYNRHHRENEILDKYLKSIEFFDNNEQIFLNEVLDLMNKFLGKPLETVVKTAGDLDGDGLNDTIVSRVYEINGKIVVDSVWRKTNETLWQHRIENPYLWIGRSDLFQCDTRDIWVIFTIAVNYAVPKLIEPFHNGDGQNKILLQGIEELEIIGIKFTQKDYLNYLNNFKGKLLQYGEPELGGGFIDIWFQPAKQFIPYYRP